MLRPRFFAGLLVGLLLGLPTGAVLTLLAAPLPSSDSEALSLRVAELSRRLTDAEEEKRLLKHQLDDFRKLAEQMAARFNDVERRFRVLERDLAAQAETPATSAPERNTPAPEQTATEEIEEPDPSE
jgi:gas vesicle protein